MANNAAHGWFGVGLIALLAFANPIQAQPGGGPQEGPIEEGPIEEGPIEEGPIEDDPTDPQETLEDEPSDDRDPQEAEETEPVVTEPVEAPCDGTLRGRITGYEEDAEEAAEVGGAKVRLLPEGAGEPLEARSDASGAYQVSGLCPGAYTIEISAEGFETLVDGWLVPGDGSRADWTLSESLVVDIKADAYDVPDVRPRETLHGRELDKTRGGSLGKALEGVNGVRTIETGAVSKPVIHGMHSNRVVILFDGVRHEAQSWGLDHGPEIDPFAANSLTVIKGAAGVRYGSDAIGGVILVEPARIPLEPGALGGEAWAVGVSNGRGGAGSLMLRGASSWIDGLGWRVQGSARKIGSLETPDYVLDNTGVEELNASGAVRLSRDRVELEVAASVFSTTTGVFTGQVAENSNQFEELINSDRPLGVDLYRFSYDIERPYQEVQHTTVKAEASYLDVELGEFTLQVDGQRNLRKEFDLVRGNVEGPQLDFDLSTVHGELLWEFSGEGLLGGVGVDAAQQDNVFAGRRLVPNYRSRSGGAFGWVQLLFTGWEAELGARVDGDQIDTYQRERVGGSNAPIEENSLSYVTPSVVAGALVEPTETSRLKLTLSSASRAPTINELFIDGVSQGLAALEQGDRDLAPEQTWGVSLDAALKPASWLTAHATAYGQYIDGFIYLAPSLDENGEPEVALTTNGGFPVFAWRQVNALFYGLDADVAVAPTSWLELRSRAALVRARDVENDNDLVLIPPDFFEQELRLKAARLGPLEDGYASVTSAFTARQRRADPDADFTSPPDAYHLLHAGLGAAVAWDRDLRLQLDLEVKNMLDVRYRNYLSRLRYFADEPGRTAIARLKLSF